jgi:hypothetical protein
MAMKGRSVRNATSRSASEAAINDGLARQTMAMKGRSVRNALKRSFNEPTFGAEDI